MLLTSRLNDPLPLLAVAGDVLLDRVRVVVVAVAFEDVSRMIEAAEILSAEDAWSGGPAARSEKIARIELVLVGDDVGRSRLWISRSRYPIREVGCVRPHLATM